MSIKYRFTTVIPKAGDPLSLPSAGVTCVVGGNNVGKSQLLRELHQLVSEADTSGLLILERAIVAGPEGSQDDSYSWLEAHAVRYDATPGSPAKYALRIGDHGQSLQDFQYWVDGRDEDESYLGNIAPFFVDHSPAGTLSAYAAGYVHPDGGTNYALMRLRRSGELEAELSQVVRDAFGFGVVLDRLDVQTRLRVGDLSVPAPPLDRPTAEYAEALARLPLLDDQGDGLRSFVGIASQILAHRFNVLLIDEPEAFLHPGQARVLGRWLAEQATIRDVQIVLATHDKDLLIGLLSASEGSNVSLVRLSKNGSDTQAIQVDPSDVAEVWQSPVLRYSNVLQGLFHSKVVVCEGDADCRFYAATLDTAAISEARRSIADDTLFVPAAGKGGIPAVLQAIARLGVEAWAFPDFDVLSNKTELKRIVEANGATWTDRMDTLYTTVARAINEKGRWEQVKESGLSAVPTGAPFEAAVQLVGCLTAVRVHVVPSGEMESFDRGIARHSSDWVFAALEHRVHEQPAALDYVRAVLAD